MPLKYHDFWSESLNTMMHLHLQKFCCSRNWALAFTAITKSQLIFLMTTEAATSHVMLQQPKQLEDVPENVGDRRTTRVPWHALCGATLSCCQITAHNSSSIFTFMQLGVFEKFTRCFFILVAFFTFYVLLCLQYTSGIAMVYLLPYSQVKPTCFVASYCMVYFLSAKKCHKSTFKYILEIV